MPTTPDHERMARIIIEGFDKHYRLFRAISAAAKQRFERGDWTAVQSANVERIEMYDQRVAEGVRALEASPEATRASHWPAIKRAFIAQLVDHQQPELAQTYFNSVASHLLHTTYYNNEHVFLRSIISTEHIPSTQPIWRTYSPATQGLGPMLRQILVDAQLANRWEDLERDVEALSRALVAELPRSMMEDEGATVQVLSSLFYRNQAAYLIGLWVDGQDRTPFAIPIRHNENHEIHLDALLLRRAELGMIFSLARAYFMVDMEVPSGFVAFLKWIFPDKPEAELYTAIGLQKQGKTLFYRDFVKQLRHSADGFVIAPGVRGMVMVVFTLPSFPYVFKVIRDKFEPPKSSDRATVMAQYRLVKNHDRVGRLADTLEFSNVAFPVERLDPALSIELESKVPSMLTREGANLIVRHLYVERRMTPLDLYLRRAKSEEEMRHGLREYGNCIRELATANIFPGDLLLKNFGVTRFGRVVFYDYDEISTLAKCNFRRLPKPANDEDEYAAEPWFSVGPNDVFPEEWPPFLFSDPRHKKIFQEEHAELLDAGYWQSLQKRVAAGEQIAFYPYPSARRFSHVNA
jgi:isocitrate dehydrogenase kinase/phosphatase